MAEIVYLNLEQVARRVRMTGAKIFELIKYGEFPHSETVFGKQYWDSDDIDEWIEERKQEAGHAD